MGKTLSKAKKVGVADIEYYGEKLILPKGMELRDAIKLLIRRQEYEEQDVSISDTFDAFPQDGANALNNVLERKYGWTPAKARQGMFGPEPPKMLTFKVGPNESIQVPWGDFQPPNINGTMSTAATRNTKGQVRFAMSATVKRKHEAQIRALFQEVHEELKNNSIYQGKAIKIRFKDDDGDYLPLPEPEFLDNDGIEKDDLIFSRYIEEAIDTNLFTPIERLDDLVANNIPIKRGILLGGPYGTGKTLAATVASNLAVENGVTYVYVPRADELHQAVEFAKLYQRRACVVFCEDIDRLMSGGRNAEIDDVLNIIDGLDTKHSNIMVVVTTNHLTNIEQAMLRPGRLDAVINMLPPDAEAIERLIRHYAGDALAKDADLKEAGQHLEGQIPAVVEEVVKRAKLSQLRRQEPGTAIKKLSGDALTESARSMKDQTDLLKPREAEKVPHLDQALEGTVVRTMRKHIGKGVFKEAK